MCCWRSPPPGRLWFPGAGKHANHDIAGLQCGSCDSSASSRLREAVLKSRRSSSLHESDQSILRWGDSAANRSARATAQQPYPAEAGGRPPPATLRAGPIALPWPRNQYSRDGYARNRLVRITRARGRRRGLVPLSARRSDSRNSSCTVIETRLRCAPARRTPAVGSAYT